MHAKKVTMERNLLQRIMQHPVTREDFVNFSYWERSEDEKQVDEFFKKEGLYRERKAGKTKREKFVQTMLKKRFLTCGRTTNMLRVTQKGRSWIHAIDAERMVYLYGPEAQSTAGLLSFGT